VSELDGNLPGRDHKLDVAIVDGELRICIGVDTLAWAAENSALWSDPYTLRVTDPDTWAEDVQRELLREEEDGSTDFDELLDGAMRRAAENGSAAIEVQDGPEVEDMED